MFKKENIIVFDTMLKLISEAIVLVNDKLKITALNSSAEEILGYKEEEVLDKSLKLFILEKKNKNLENFYNYFLKNDKTKHLSEAKDVYVSHKNGATVQLRFLSLNPFEINGEKYILSLISKTENNEETNKKTSQENLEEKTRTLSNTVDKLEKMNQRLDTENKKRIAAESKAKEALKKEKELNELKTKFLSMVSHEFKTPLTGISISTMLLAKYKLTEQHDKREKHLSVINSKVHYLNSILNNFLSIEKLDENKVKYNIETLRIKNIIDGVIDGAKILLKEGQQIICISVIDDIVIQSDEKVIELIIGNLINNAIKYSRDNTTIFIDIEQNKQTTIIKIIDKGFGIPEKEQKNIFKRYYRAENVLLFEGTGIGLNIIKTHIENIGGSITFESKLHIGTTFTVSIPNKIE